MRNFGIPKCFIIYSKSYGSLSLPPQCHPDHITFVQFQFLNPLSFIAQTSGSWFTTDIVGAKAGTKKGRKESGDRCCFS